MASTYTLITSNTLSGSAASVTFSSIPSTYTDLVLIMSMRVDAGGGASVNGFVSFRFNSDSSILYSTRTLEATGTTASSTSSLNKNILWGQYLSDGSSATANTFSNVEIYIPSYTSTQNKPISISGATESNTSSPYITAVAGLYRNTSAISSVTIYPDSSSSPAYNFVSDSSFYLYGIKNS